MKAGSAAVELGGDGAVCLAVCRTKGNFTAATGVASNVRNLTVGKECVTA